MLPKAVSVAKKAIAVTMAVLDRRMIRISRSPLDACEVLTLQADRRFSRIQIMKRKEAPANRGLHAAPSQKYVSPEVGGEPPVDACLDLVDVLLVLHPERRGDRGAAGRDRAVDGDRLGAEVEI